MSWFEDRVDQSKGADLVVLYLHGGGYALGHPLLDALNLFIAERLAMSGLTTAILAHRYTLTPGGRFPQQIDEVAPAYDWLVKDLGVSPAKVVLMGESAGRHLALSFLLAHHMRSKQGRSSVAGLARPASAILISPWCDLHNSNSRAINLRSAEGQFKQLLTKRGGSTLRDLDASHREAFSKFSRRDARCGFWKDILPSSTWVSTGDDENIFVHDIIDFVRLRGTMAPMLSLRSSLVDMQLF